ncbi:MAG: molybdenum cofactor guanylyltransferase [Chloroflexi bacterium]|nr:molybdenum cofactor guanylyltransferase [Chloroflexota bacterium]
MYSISIQAGGQSTRMGSNKALILFEGLPLVQRVLVRVRLLSADVFVTTNSPDGFPDLGTVLYRDVYSEACALCGLITAFHYAQNDVVAVVACDMPFIVPALIAAECELLLNMGVDAVIPRTRNGLEPLLAAYRVSTCQPAATEALKAGKRRMISWFDSVKIHEIGEDVIQLFDPDMRSFININTLEDLHQAQWMAKNFD